MISFLFFLTHETLQYRQHATYADRVFSVADQVDTACRVSLSTRIVEEVQSDSLKVVSIDIKKVEILGVVFVPYRVSNLDGNLANRVTGHPSPVSS